MDARPRTLWRDPWAWISALSPACLFLHLRGAPLGEAVAEDFDYLHHALFGPTSLLDGGGSGAFWRPLSYQLYYQSLGELILDHPRWVAALNGLLLALATVVLYRLFRTVWSGPAAAAAATFPMLSESTRTLVAWSGVSSDLGVYLFSILALFEASRARIWTAMLTLAAALLCKETAVITAALLPFVPRAPGAPVRVRIRWLLASGAVLLVWAGLYSYVRRDAGLELPHGIERDPNLLALGFPARLGWAAWNSLRAMFSLSLARGPSDIGAYAVFAGLLVIPALLFLREAPARSRLLAARPWMMWGLTWIALSIATLTSVFPLWSPNRALFGALGFGTAFAALAGAAHPGLPVLLMASRLALFAAAPGAAVEIAPEPADRGAFVDIPRLTRLQRLMAATRRELSARYPSLPAGSAVGWQNLPLWSEYAFSGEHALQAWYRDSSLRWVSIEEFKSDPAQPIVTFVSYQPFLEDEIVLISPEAVRWRTAGQRMLEQQRWDASLDAFARSDSSQEDRRAVLFLGHNAGLRAQVLATLRRFPEAEVEARRSLRASVHNTESRFILALALAVRGDPTGAMAELDTLLSQEPRHEDGLTLRARLRGSPTGSPR